MYRRRHLAENRFARLEEVHAVATRHDKADQSYAANILLAAVIASR